MKPIILFLFVFSTLAAQHKSIHQIEWEQHRALHKETSSPDVYDPLIAPLDQTNSTELARKVFAFLPDWEYPAALSNVRYDLLTHIAAFDFTVSPDGSIGNPAGWPWTDLINQAHSNGVKVILTAVNFNSSQINTIMTNESVKNAFFVNLKNKIDLYSLDGVNIDFENLNSADRGVVLNGFMTDLTTYMHENIPGSEVSFDGPAVNWGGWELGGLAASCDYIFIMGYAFAGSWSTVSGSTAPLVGGSINITNTILTQYAAVTNNTPEKLILGVPYYGNRFQTESSTAHSIVADHLGSVLFRTAASEFENYGTLWDASTESPWYRYQSSGNWYQVWCDNAQSIDAKFDLADSKSLLGVGMWALNYDGNRTDFWNVIQQHYGSGQPLPSEPTDLFVFAKDEHTLQIQFSASEFANGYWLYYGTDGLSFPDSSYLTANSGTLGQLESDALYFVKVRAVNASGLGSETGVLAATTHGPEKAGVLIVDGFDRQANTVNPRNYIRMHAQSLFNNNRTISSVSNEAVAKDSVYLADYKMVDWMLGDESTTDETFSNTEQQKVKSYLESGGNLFVSGAEIGWDLGRGTGDDLAFYQNYLKAKYIDDAPLGNNATYYTLYGIAGTAFEPLNGIDFDNGENGTFDVDWPDAIQVNNGSQLCFAYTDVAVSNGGAGICYSGTFGTSAKISNLVYMAVPFETIYQIAMRDSLMSAILKYFDTHTMIADKPSIQPDRFSLLPNIPNPFNPQTKIRFLASLPGAARIKIFSSSGKNIRSSERINFSAGESSWIWNGLTNQNQAASSGMYFYTVEIITSEQPEILTGKMILIR
ncbi:MAG: hypothetical protein KDF60_09935 [Calditrichaeota bacterium]|nr:hypothetical protein [Calditrichota bacterium]